MSSVGQQYENAVTSGNTGLADYLAQVLAVQNGINPNGVTAASPSDLLPGLPGVGGAASTTAPASTGDFWSNTLSSGEQALMNAEQLLTNPLSSGALNTLLGGTAGAVAGGATAAGQAASSAASALSFITDIPRVATTVLGVIILIAGIFALTKGPAVNIISSAAALA